MKKNLLLFLFCHLCQLFLFPQSSGAIDKFTNNGKPLTLEVGRGFVITDLNRQTKPCFIPSTSNRSKLKSKDGAPKSTISMYFTKTENEYKFLRKQGVSGKIGYSNLFALGSSGLDEYSSNSYLEKERIVFVAKIDFGRFTFDGLPTLTPESKSLITKKDYDGFINSYGSHYVNGEHRENSIWVVLTKSSNQNQMKQSSLNSLYANVKTPYKLKSDFEVNDSEIKGKKVNSQEYSVDVEINGPAIGKDKMITEITNLLDGENIVSRLKEFLIKALEGMNDPNNSYATKYYYSPFSLFDVGNINWDDKKENQLMNINENVLQVHYLKGSVSSLIASGGNDKLNAEFENKVKNFPQKEQYRKELNNVYNYILPNINDYNHIIDTTYNYLKKIYTSCADIRCDLSSTCGITGSYEEKIDDLTYKVSNDLSKLDKIISEAWKASLPECEREAVGYVTIVNTSLNPYDLYNGEKFLMTMEGKTSKRYKLNPGQYNFKATQTKGYLMYPTVNKRPIAIKTCEDSTIKIGFED